MRCGLVWRLLLLVVVCRGLPGWGQGAGACGKAPGILQATKPNIFSEEQEQWLGEAMADYVDRYYTPVRNKEENAYVATIGARLLAALPPTGIRFHYTLVESAEVNGFSLAGGQVYLTRKLVASAHSEDEVAGVIAHEMGHILSHQFAVETTADLKLMLGVTAVGDRADVYAKFQRLTDARQHDKHYKGGDGDSDEKQDEADRVAVYAAAAAGYRPAAYGEFWDRSFFVGGKTGNFLSDLFQKTTMTQKRLRGIRAMVAELPGGCGATADRTSVAFQAWQRQVLEDQSAAVVAGEAAGAAKEGVALTPPLQVDVNRMRFSADGKYVLAQDERSVFVLTREPFAEVLRFDAEGASAARFTPDSAGVTFLNESLHVEHWSIAEKKLVAARELNLRQSCWETLLSPDGRSVVCLTVGEPVMGSGSSMELSVLDTTSGAPVYQQKNFMSVSIYEIGRLLSEQAYGIPHADLASSFSRDGNVLLLGEGDGRIALDLRTRTPIKLGGMLKDEKYRGSYCFSGDDKVFAVNTWNKEDSGLFSFPDGQRVAKYKLNFGGMAATSDPTYVLVQGMDGQVRLADVAGEKYVFASRGGGLDVFQGEVVAGSVGGALLLVKVGAANAAAAGKHVTLSAGPLGRTRVAGLSPDGKYFALSSRTRGGVWDAETGKRIFLVRGFHETEWQANGTLLAQFYAFEKEPATVAELTMRSPPSSKTMSYKLPDGAGLVGGHLMAWKMEKDTWMLTAYEPADLSVAWVRRFEHGKPGLTTNDGNDELVLSYLMTLPLGKDKLKGDAGLRDEANGVKEKVSGRVIEVVNGKDGTERAEVVVEVPRSYAGVDGFNHVGDLLYLNTGDNRTLVYSMKTGEQLRQVFGSVVAVDHGSGRVCTINRRDEATVLSAEGKELQHVALESPVRFAELRDEGRTLVVLTADQRLHRIAVGMRTTATASAP